jgi:general stress protein 26
MSWKNTLKQGKEIVLVSASKSGKPHAIVVISQGLIDKNLLINACQTKNTLKNISNNESVCVVAKDRNEYYRINGIAKIFRNGKFYELGKKRNIGPAVRCVIAIKIKQVFDLDKVKKIL